jgi:hypothetical protein
VNFWLNMGSVKSQILHPSKRPPVRQLTLAGEDATMS